MNSEFIVAMCRDCGNIQVLQVKDYAKATLKCFNCTHSNKIHDATKGGFVVKTWGVGSKLSCRQATALCQEIKKRKGEDKL